MNVAGHLAFAFLTSEAIQAPHRRGLHPARDTRTDVLVLFGALIPDLIDKPLRLVGYTPHGRSIGHALLVLALFTCLALLTSTLFPRTRALALLAYGWASHFVADTLDDFVAGLESTGYLWTSWMGWPWWTQDDLWVKVFDRTTPLPGFSSLEWATFMVAFLVAFVQRQNHRRLSPTPFPVP